jgi:hypothetical protein
MSKQEDALIISDTARARSNCSNPLSELTRKTSHLYMKFEVRKPFAITIFEGRNALPAIFMIYTQRWFFGGIFAAEASEIRN